MVEVHSPSTEYKDKNQKLQDYMASSSIEEIVFVNQFAQEVRVYFRSGQRWNYQGLYARAGCKIDKPGPGAEHG
ncbi:Uma2 family endonuclease [Ktedonobacter sp. SOSP1-52]|uniref:Uma2 family endonuclease n=1 Tax=Ktedonobacter sp. SOSP1-52 TaxID=2778366 RepID=UPI001915B521